ncbi:MAG: NifU N-terminal domain-containing protein [Tepidisphaeraceae bacterium]
MGHAVYIEFALRGARGIEAGRVATPMGFKVLEIQPTPNPNAFKFVLDRSVSQQPLSFFNVAAAKDHPLASKLFGIDGVSSLLLLGDFITINKSPAAAWDDIKHEAKAVLKAEID